MKYKTAFYSFYLPVALAMYMVSLPYWECTVLYLVFVYACLCEGECKCVSKNDPFFLYRVASQMKGLTNQPRKYSSEWENTFRFRSPPLFCL